MLQIHRSICIWLQILREMDFLPPPSTKVNTDTFSVFLLLWCKCNTCTTMSSRTELVGSLGVPLYVGVLSLHFVKVLGFIFCPVPLGSQGLNWSSGLSKSGASVSLILWLPVFTLFLTCEESLTSFLFRGKYKKCSFFLLLNFAQHFKLFSLGILPTVGYMQSCRQG